MRSLSLRLSLVAILLGILTASPTVAQKRVPPLNPGDPFPAGTYQRYNPVGDETEVNLADVLGSKAVVFFYWIPGNERAGEVFAELQALVKEIGSEQLELYGLVVPNPGIGVTGDVVRAKLGGLGIDVPVLRDEDFFLGQKLAVRSVPNISIVDRSGRLRLMNGGSLKQTLEYKVDLAAAVRRAAEREELYDYGFLDPYFPVRELEGQTSPDFRAPLLADSVEQRWHSLIDDEKVNVLIFWSVECPHCRESLPEIDAWLKANPAGVNVVGCAAVTNRRSQERTKEFCELNDFAFRNLVDHDAEIGKLYGVTSTPTIVIVGPDGVVDSAVVSSQADFGRLMERKKRELLASGS